MSALAAVLAYLAVHGHALALGVLLGAAVAALWLVPAPQKSTATRPASSNRKSGRVPS